MTGTESELESLLAFLYAAPVGLVRAQPDGTIDLVNGAAMRLLLPLAAAPQHLGNLFDALFEWFGVITKSCWKTFFDIGRCTSPPSSSSSRKSPCGSAETRISTCGWLSERSFLPRVSCSRPSALESQARREWLEM